MLLRGIPAPFIMRALSMTNLVPRDGVKVVGVKGAAFRFTLAPNKRLPRPKGVEILDGLMFNVRGMAFPEHQRFAYQRISGSLHTANGYRRVNAACWHGYRDFMWIALKLTDALDTTGDGRITTQYADYKSLKQFEVEHGGTGSERDAWSVRYDDQCGCASASTVWYDLIAQTDQAIEDIAHLRQIRTRMGEPDLSDETIMSDLVASMSARKEGGCS
jgi:hypothetical protein